MSGNGNGASARTLTKAEAEGFMGQLEKLGFKAELSRVAREVAEAAISEKFETVAEADAGHEKRLRALEALQLEETLPPTDAQIEGAMEKFLESENAGALVNAHPNFGRALFAKIISPELAGAPARLDALERQLPDWQQQIATARAEAMAAHAEAKTARRVAIGVGVGAGVLITTAVVVGTVLIRKAIVKV